MNEKLTTKSCDVCGKRISNDRLTLKGLIGEFIDSSFSLDKGFIYTLKQLIVSPNQPIEFYISGKRQPFTSPAKFLVVSVTLYVIGFLFLPIEDFAAVKFNENEQNFAFSFYRYFQRFLNVGLFGLIPLISLATWAMSYNKYNYAENLVANAYIHGWYNIVTIILSMLGFLLIKANFSIGISLSSISFVFLIRNYFLFFEGKIFTRILKTFGALFISTLMVGIYALILIFYLVYILKIEPS